MTLAATVGVHRGHPAHFSIQMLALDSTWLNTNKPLTTAELKPVEPHSRDALWKWATAVISPAARPVRGSMGTE